MTDLLTHEEYRALAAKLALPTNAFIDGSYRPAASGKTFATVNPATGETLAEIAACGAEDVDFAVLKAREAFDDGRWSRLARAERKAIQIGRASRRESVSNSEVAVTVEKTQLKHQCLPLTSKHP